MTWRLTWAIARRCASGLATLAALALSPQASLAGPMPELGPNGDVYRQSHIDGDISCDGRAVTLAGNHTKLHLAGDCRRVRVAGEHNDIFVQVGPGAVIEITGAHNDVTWIATHRGVHPTLVDRGLRNTFHASAR